MIFHSFLSQCRSFHFKYSHDLYHLPLRMQSMSTTWTRLKCNHRLTFWFQRHNIPKPKCRTNMQRTIQCRNLPESICAQGKIRRPTNRFKRQSCLESHYTNVQLWSQPRGNRVYTTFILKLIPSVICTTTRTWICQRENVFWWEKNFTTVSNCSSQTIRMVRGLQTC